MESEAKIDDQFLLELSDGINLVVDFALQNAPVKEARERRAELIKGCKGHDIEQGVPPSGSPIESESELYDFRSISFGFRELL